MIHSKTIEKAIYRLCVEANTKLEGVEQILECYNCAQDQEIKQNLGLILKNAQMAMSASEPLCQDTGQVLVFLRVGQAAQIQGENINLAINSGVKKAYGDNFYRKSVVKNALFDRKNTADNTPAIIYTEIVDGDKIKIDLLIKGAGAENMSEFKMLSPTSGEDEVIDFILEVVKNSGTNACPPLFVGVGIGGTLEYAGVLSKKALVMDKNIDELHQCFADKIKSKSDKILDVKVLISATHIACMPVAVTLNCHSSRHASCEISADEIFLEQKKITPDLKIEDCDFEDYIKIHVSEVERIKKLKRGQKILLSGEIFTARDAAHKKLVELIEAELELPFDLNNKIIFYAGPCPSDGIKIIGSVGPTTASRMDKFAPVLYQKGVIATIGKGERANNIGGIYFSMLGGIACYSAQKVLKNELIAFGELGAEAIYRLEVDNLPLRVE